MVFSCCICRIKVMNVRDYVSHLKCHFIVKGTTTAHRLSCCACRKGFNDIKTLVKHIRRSHFEKQHACPDCGKAFMSTHKLKIHSVCHSHFAEFMCSLCGRNYKRKDKLCDHFIKKHSGVPVMTPSLVVRKQKKKRFRYPKLPLEEVAKFRYHCSVCFVGFNRRGFLINHLSKFHAEVALSSCTQISAPVLQAQRAYKCLYCDRVYMSNGKRKSHTLTCHPGSKLGTNLDNVTEIGRIEIKPHLCSMCPRQFLTNAKLLQHGRKHHPSI